MSVRAGIDADGCVMAPVGAVMRSVGHRPGHAGNIIVPLLAGKLADARRGYATNVIAMIGVGIIGRAALQGNHVGIIGGILRSRMVVPRHGRGSDDSRSEQGSRKEFELGHLVSPFFIKGRCTRPHYGVEKSF